MAAAPPPCCVPTAWVGMGAAGASTTTTATPSAKAACPGASSSARTWAPTACRQWKTGCGWKDTPTASARSAGGSGPARTGPAKGPDGIDEDEKPNEYPSGARINVSIWDMIEKKFPELGNERTLQGSNSSASPGKEKRSAGDKKRDKKWREYQESLAAEAAQAAENETKGGTPGPNPQRTSGSHHPGHTSLGDFLEVAKKAKAKRQAPSAAPEEVRTQQRRGVGPPWEDASRPSQLQQQRRSDQRDVACACERACGVPCNLRVARQQATQQNAAVEGAVGIAQEEAADWGRGMAFHASTVAAIAAGLTAAAAQEEATARVRSEVAAAAQEARLAQEAIVRKEAEVRALEEALAQERAKKEAEERAHTEATAKAQADAARKDAIEAARRKVAEERAKTEAELAALEAEKAWLQRAREAEAARAREEAERRAAAATAAAMEEAEAKLQRETPPGGSRLETLRKLFEGDASSKMTLDLEEVDTGSSGDSGPTAHRRRRGKLVRGRPPRGHGGQRTDNPTTPTPSSPPATGTDETADIAEEWLEEESEKSPSSRRVRVRISLLPTGARSPPSARPRRLGGSTWTRMMTWTSASWRSPHPRTHRGDPAEAHRDPPAEDHQDPLEEAHQVDPPEADLRVGQDPRDREDPAEALLEDPLGDPDSPPEEGDPEATWRWIAHLRRRVQTLEHDVDTGKGEMIPIARVAAGAQKELNIAKTEMVKIAKVATAAQRELDIARGETTLLNN